MVYVDLFIFICYNVNEIKRGYIVNIKLKEMWENMYRKIIKWLIRKFVFLLDKDDSLLVYSFGKDEVTDYYIFAERFYEDKHMFGVKEEVLKGE